MKGTVARIQRFSTTNGPGIRSTVFLKGCPLRCRWCHNPEMQKKEPELLVYQSQCICCGACVKACRNGVHELSSENHIVHRERCLLSGECGKVCPVRAIEICGREMSGKEVFSILSRDRIFYDQSKGGITVSGGEPLFQPEFTLEILKLARESGIHTAVDTSGFGQGLRELIPYTDLFLWDIKAVNPEIHEQMTGQPLRRMLASLELVRKAQVPIRFRCPIIPGVNDNEEHLDGIIQIVKNTPSAIAVDLLSYHRLGTAKALAIGEEQEDFGSVREDFRMHARSILQKALPCPAGWS